MAQRSGRLPLFRLTASALTVLVGAALLTTYGGESRADGARPLATSPFPFPHDGTGMVPLWPGSPEPIESTQFTLPDGTLVTRFGLVGRNRHARERGEGWAEIGYGKNETVDAAGNPVDKGPGHYLDFVKNYFQNRTWGVEIIDNSRVAGVTVPTLKINNYFQEAQRAGGRSFFHRFDSPGVTGFGWMSPGKLVDSKLYGVDEANCPVVPRPPNGALLHPDTGLNDGCSATVNSFPGHDALSYDTNGVLVPSKNVPGATRFYDFAVTNGETGIFVPGKNVPSRPLKVGDAVEFTQAFFSTPEAMAAVGDNGAFHYYTTEVTYVVGTGLRPWYGIQPRLNSAPLPDETLQGGTGSVSYDYSDGSTFIFQQQQNNIGMQDMQRFVEGRRLLHSNMTTGDHNEPGNDRNPNVVGLQGPSFNQSSCFACHVNNGRSPAPATLNQKVDQMVVRVGAYDQQGQLLPDPNYGVTVQMNAYDAKGKLVDLGRSVRVAGFDTHSVSLADGTSVELRKPRLSFSGPVPQVVSLRAAQPIIGLGLLEAIPEADILARVRATPDEDGVKGQANFVFDPDTGAVRLGRFGWKAGKFSLRHQSASALLEDMSVTTSVFPSRECLSGPATCKTAPAEKGLTDADLQAVSRYLSLVAVPAQRSVESGFPKGVAPLPYLDVDPPKIARGEAVFKSAHCASCHTAQMKTGSGHEFQEVRDQTIKPYTDLLLHDMGPDLADNYAEGLASGSMWRTTPLWGIGYTERVMGTGGTVGYLHDGRARTLTEAVMWHGGEAERAKQRFAALAAADRQALLAFLQSL
ncbi:di-heme oxidoredictase family protein [Luteibacter sp.]|uniref:di-heme oxidoreductase family protein n=1 Tax=Luteibacter sp. TaxID=1886636 RepID=UPI0025C23327|nr:di-heme oxidoredictase family protein [Luteibacter sp.]